MKPGTNYTLYHPRWYRRPVSVWWWLENWDSTRFVLREISGSFTFFFALVYLWQVRAVAQGPEAYARFLERMASPLFVALHLITFVFVLFHAVTWFNLAPRAIVMRFRGARVPDAVIVGMNYLAGIVSSAVVAWFLLRG